MTSFDYLIVGAGTAGCVLAARLSEDSSVTVGIIEAGPDYPDMDSLPSSIKQGLYTSADIIPGDHEWGIHASPNSHARPMLVPRGKVVGGSSAVNGQMFLRGIPEDFNNWAAEGNPQWDFDAILPYYKKLERDLNFSDEYHGTSGPIPVWRHSREDWLSPQKAFESACISEGYESCPDHNAPYVSGVGATPLNQLEGVRWSTSVGYLMPARQRPNLQIVANATVTKLVIKNGTTSGAEAIIDGRRESFNAREVILAAGPIGSPQLLMLSGIGPESVLRKHDIDVAVDSPGVGQNLRDHPNIGLLWPYADGFSVGPDQPRYQVILRYTAPGSTHRNDMQVFFSSFATPRVDRGGDGMTSLGIAMQPVLNLAKSQGTLSLRSADPHEQPDLEYHLLDESFDIERMSHAIRMCAELGKHPAFEGLVSGETSPDRDTLESDEQLEEWMRQNVGTTHHISGTSSHLWNGKDGTGFRSNERC